MVDAIAGGHEATGMREGVEFLRFARLVLDWCTDEFLERYSLEDLLALVRAQEHTNVLSTPEDWTERQREDVLRQGRLPRWDEETLEPLPPCEGHVLVPGLERQALGQFAWSEVSEVTTARGRVVHVTVMRTSSCVAGAAYFAHGEATALEGEAAPVTAAVRDLFGHLAREDRAEALR